MLPQNNAYTDLLKQKMLEQADKQLTKGAKETAEQMTPEQLAQLISQSGQAQTGQQSGSQQPQQNSQQPEMQQSNINVQTPQNMLQALFQQRGIQVDDKGNITVKSPGLFNITPSSIGALKEAEKLRAVTGQGDTKDVYSFNPRTGTVQHTATIPAKSDVRNLKESVDISDLSSDQQVAAWQLSRNVGGVRGAEKVLPAVVQGLREGKDIDTISDELRYMQQSPEFVDVRGAIQQIMLDKPEKISQQTFDYLDDLVQNKDIDGAKDFIKRAAIKVSSAEQQNKVMGQERTVEFLGEIKDNLATLEANGINTNFLTGNMENLRARVGQVQNPEMRKVATKIMVAIMNYRRAMTGAQFGEQESREYKALFPNIDKIGQFNEATISALEETFQGDLDKFYSMSMGKKNYDRLFSTESNKTIQQIDAEIADIERQLAELK